MGGQVSKLMSRIFGSKEMRILMLGLDAAGKTSKHHPAVSPPKLALTFSILLQLFSTNWNSTRTSRPSPQSVLMWKVLPTRMSNSMSGMLVDKTRSVRYGGTIILVCADATSRFAFCERCWRHLPNVGTQGLIFVIDSSDTARMNEARSELHKIINDREMKDALLLVFANKQDIAGRMFALSRCQDIGLL